MSFIDYPYYIFILILLLIITYIKKDNRWIFLLIFSVIFYGVGRWEYLLLLLFSISIDYFCAINIATSASLVKRKIFLILSITSNIALLFFFKYFTEIYDNWSWLEIRTSVLNIDIKNILLPLGISFYTLQSMGYTIDVYRKKILPEKHFGYFSLYVCFFPQLVAGPIERPKNLLPQLHNPKQITVENIQSGLFLIGFGLFKKLIIADRLFVLLNDSLSSTESLFGWQAVSFGTLVILAVYMDISVYTDIARGSARLFGIELSVNFKRPMLALSLAEFWKRWHISLTSWIMEYLFTPLAKLNTSKTYRHLVLIITFFVIGLWHGGTLPFILMGLLQGVIIVSERILQKKKIKWPNNKVFNIIRLVRTHIILNISGVLFLSPTMNDAVNIYYNMFNFEYFIEISILAKQLHGVFFLSLLIFGLCVVYIFSLLEDKIKITRGKNILLYMLFFVVVAFSERLSDDFIYFIF